MTTRRPPFDESFSARREPTEELLLALSQHPLEMADSIAELHRPVRDAESLVDLMRRTAGEATRLIPGAVWAGVTAVFDHTPFTVAHTDNRVLVVDESQYDDGDGPCLEAINTHRVVHVHTDQIRRRWPLVAAAADLAGVVTFHAVPVLVDNVAVAALNLYCSDPLGLESIDADTLDVLTEYLSAGLAGYIAGHEPATRGVRLRIRLENRNTLDHAAGILVVTRRISPEEALWALFTEARNNGVNAVTAARHIIRRHRPPPTRPATGTDDR